MKYNIENDFVTDYLHKENYPDGFGHGDGATKVKPYLCKIVKRSGSVAAYTPNDCERPRVIDANALLPGDSIEGQLRMIWTNRCYNMRDIGGWPCGDGKRLAYGKIIRGAEIGGLADTSVAGVTDDIETLTKVVGINVEIDLRGKQEYKVSPLGKSVKLYNNSSYGCTGYGDFITNKKTKTILSTIISEVSKGNTVFVHCAQGADRTGLICFTIEALCGCSEDSLIKDWELTSFGDYLYTKYIDEEGELRKVFRELYEGYGGKSGKSIGDQVYAWAKKKIGITDAQIETLRKCMVVEDADAYGQSDIAVTEKKETEEVSVVLPWKIAVSDLTKFTVCGISTGFGTLNADKEPNFYYIAIPKGYFGRTLTVTYTGTCRHFSLLRKIPSKVGDKVSLADGYDDIDGSWTTYVGMSVEQGKTRSITIPTDTTDSVVYLFVQEPNEKKMTITIK